MPKPGKSTNPIRRGPAVAPVVLAKVRSPAARVSLAISLLRAVPSRVKSTPDKNAIGNMSESARTSVAPDV